MDTKVMGKRIKEIRLSKKMTQSEVVGDFITRNMLSQIESGLATPSMNTLEYIAKALGVTCSTLMVNEESNEISALNAVKQAMKETRYDEAILLGTMLPYILQDEADALLARSYLEIAKKYAEGKEFKLAVKNAKLAAEKAQKGIYSSRDLRTNALLLLDEISPV